MFFHAMAQAGGHCQFESLTLATNALFEFAFPDASEVYDYLCRIHGASMAGRIRDANKKT